MGQDSSRGAQEADDGLLSSIPAMPTVPGSQVYRGTPKLIVESRLRHSLGWQNHRKVGPSFVVVALMALDRVKVISRFALTEQGWEGAWRSLSGLDADAAAAVAAKLASTEQRKDTAAALAALDADTVRCLWRLTYNGGSDLTLVGGRAYDLRFLGDRLMICPSASATARLVLPYDQVEGVDISGTRSSMSTGGTLALILGLGLLGAVLGLVIHRLVGLMLGAMLFGFIGALAAAGSAKIETIVRLRGRGSEFFFGNAEKAPDAVRIDLSGPLAAIAGARAARQDGMGDSERAVPASQSIPDQLSKLATLLADGVLSREEFEHLKAIVMAQT